MPPDSHDTPTVGETADALSAEVEALNNKEGFWILFQMSYNPAYQHTLSALLQELQAWKRDHPGQLHDEGFQP